MTPSRLARYFKGSRDNWKDKALEKQNKLRVFEQKIRDLEKSRGQWKSQAKKAEKKVKELEKELEKLKKVDKASADFQKVKTLTAISHHYTIQTIQLSVQQVIEGGNSYRSASTTMTLLSENFEIDSPHFSSIRKWVGRVGLYELNRKKEKRDDWIFIVDLTLELGQEKAMIVSGVTIERYQEIMAQEKRALQHTDGEILTLEVTTTATGEFIQEISHLKTENSILATTDVLESIFGKYKHFSSRCPLKDLRQMLLTIPLSTMKLTTDVVKNALETIRGGDLEEWVERVFGQSMLSKRKTLFSAARCDMKTA